MAVTTVNPVIRIPNLPQGKIANEDGTITQEWLTFMQTFISNMQSLFDPEGVVLPTQAAADISIIEANTEVNPSGGSPVFTTEYGTGLYNSTANSIMFAVDGGGGVPLFKTVTLT